MDTSSVILAVASPPGRSLRGIIRISGAATFELLRDHLKPETPGLESEISNPKSRISGQRSLQRGLHRASLRLGNHFVPALVIVFPAPHSYTGEDSVEIQLPGNQRVLERVIDELLGVACHRVIDCRRAAPGEFTARAFLNGRLSLTQAEGVAATIAAQSDAELRAAALLRCGSLDRFARQLTDDLAWALAMVEAGIDFTDQEEVVAITPRDLRDRLRGISRRIEDQLNRAIGLEQLQAIPWVVLVGEPNAGKSALFNALLGHERAVVSPIAGTTRDALTEPLTIQTPHGPAEVMLVDLAGFDPHDDSPINRLMQQAATDAIRRAELIIRCVPVDQPSTHYGPPSAKEIVARTKSDLKVSAAACRFAPSASHREIAVSAFTGRNLDQLRSLIAQRLSDRAVSLAADCAALRPRHESALRTAHENLRQAIALVDPHAEERSLSDPELIASAMRAALDDLGTLGGQTTPDDILGRVFASFCVGK